MNQIMKKFEHPEFGSVRTVFISDEPWFVGSDVAAALQYKNARDALKKHVDEDDKGVAICDTPGGAQEMAVINESGLYSLILSSKLESAKRFKHWVTSEVLPDIRRTGGYTMLAAPTRPLTTDDYLEAARIVSKCTPVKLDIVLDLLSQGGFSVLKVREQKQQRCLLMVPEGISGFLDTLTPDELEGQATDRIYGQYAEWCAENDLRVCSKEVFSKHCCTTFGIRTKSARVEGKVKRVFTGR